MDENEAGEYFESGEEEDRQDEELEEGEEELEEEEEMQPEEDVEGEVDEGEVEDGNFEEESQDEVPDESPQVAASFSEDQEEEGESQEEDDGQPEEFFNSEAEGGVEEGTLIPKTDEDDLPDSGDGEVPAGKDEIALTELLATDNESLYDPDLGYGPQANLRTTVEFHGFTTAFQDYFFPLIDSQSGVLFEIVQGLERAVYKSNEDILKGMKDPVAIPGNRLVVKTGGPEIRLRIMDPLEPITGGFSGPSVKAPQSPAGSKVSILKSPDLIQLEKQITSAEKAFSPEKLEMLMIPFEQGWKREIVIRSHGGSAKKLGDVYYFSPQGVKYRSSKQVAVFLSKHPQMKMSADNFSFAKARVSYDIEHETVRAAHGGRGLNPVKNAQQRQQIVHNVSQSSSSMDEEDSNGLSLDSEADSVPSEESVKARGGRRSIQPPKRYATAEFLPEPKRAKIASKASLDKDMSDMYGGMQMGTLPPKYRGMEEEKSGEQMLQEFRAKRGRPSKAMGAVLTSTAPRYIHSSMHSSPASSDDGPMFGISALTQGAPFSNYTEGLEYSSSVEAEGYDADTSMDTGEDETGSQGKGELLPCSIRCLGQTGEIPTLQCKRCLCLYHPGCLGLPNQSYRNFLCSNCEGDPSGSESSDEHNSPIKFNPMKMMKRSEPPPLIQLKSGMMRRILPKMPNLQPPLRGQGLQSRMQGFSRLNPPSLMRPGMAGGMEMRRGRGRPRMVVPQLNSRSVTITPISLPRQRGGSVQHPVVPRLQPMSNPQGYRGMMRRGSPVTLPQRGRPPKSVSLPRGGSNAQMNFQWEQQQQMMMKRPGQVPMVRQRVPSLSPMSGMRRRGGATGMKNSNIFRVDQTGRVLPNSSNSMLNEIRPQFPRPQQQHGQFHRYAQSVVTINQKKYVAVPKNSSGASSQVKPPGHRNLERRPITLQEFVEQTRKEKAERMQFEEEAALSAESETETIRTNGDAVDSLESTDDSCPDDVDPEATTEVDSDNGDSVVLPKGSRRFVLSLIFQHINTIDKIKCRKICRLWDSVINEAECWEELSLQDVKVKNWTSLKDFIVNHSVRTLDTRGAVINDMEGFWQQLLSLDYEVATTEAKPLHEIIITTDVSNWADGTLLQEFEDTGRCKIIVC